MIYFNVCWDPCAKLEILLADWIDFWKKMNSYKLRALLSASYSPQASFIHIPSCPLFPKETWKRLERDMKETWKREIRERWDNTLLLGFPICWVGVAYEMTDATGNKQTGWFWEKYCCCAKYVSLCTKNQSLHTPHCGNADKIVDIRKVRVKDSTINGVNNKMKWQHSLR